MTTVAALVDSGVLTALSPRTVPLEHGAEANARLERNDRAKWVLSRWRGAGRAGL